MRNMNEVAPLGQIAYWTSVFFSTLLIFYVTLAHEPPYYLLLIPITMSLFGAWIVRPLWCAGSVLLLVFAAFLLKTLTDL